MESITDVADIRRLGIQSITTDDLEIITQVFGANCRAFSAPAATYKPSDTVDVEIVRKKGIDLIHDPLFNKVYTSPPSAR